MIKNYFNIAIRNILKHKGYSFINITGLTIGIASCIIIFHFVAFEYSFDKFHDNSSDLYRVNTALARTGEKPEPGGYTGLALGPALKAAVPEIIHFARLHPEYGEAIVSNPSFPERVFEEKDIYYVDPSFLKMFTFPVERGNSQSLESGTVIISKSVAKKYFHNDNPLGQVLHLAGQITKSFRVTEIFKELPSNSHLKFEMLLPIEDLLRSEQYVNEPEGGWSWNNFITYIQIHKGADPKTLERKMTEVFVNHRGEVLKKQGYTAAVFAQPLDDIHLNSKVDSPIPSTGSYETIYFFSVVGIFTLLIALVNYVNLATARSLNRAREVGVRKVVGAQRKQLIFQFLFESALTNIIAALLAIVLVEIVAPLINDLAGINLSGALWSNPWFWGLFLVIFLFCALLAGLYPGFILSSFKPVLVLKGKIGSFMTQVWLLRSLVVFQFTISVLLISGTVVVYNQLNYMLNIDLGINTEHILTVKGPKVLPEGKEHEAAISTFLQELKQLPNIHQAASSWSVPGERFNWNGAALRKSTDDPSDAITGVATYVDSGFASLYGLELVAGKGFTDMTGPEDADSSWLVVLNETAVKSLGIKSPQEAIAQYLDIGNYRAIVMGVYKDFNWSSAHIPRQNMIFGYTAGGGLISLKVNASNISETIKSIEAIYNRLFPGNVFNYSFLNEAFDQQYKRDQKFAELFTIFAGLAILIACLGLFGLANFTTRQRVKEIGVRKVLGASITEIVVHLSKGFLALVIIAVIIATPLTYYFMNEWLENYAYRAPLGVLDFVLTGALVLIIAILSVSYQCIRAALANPVNSLRYE